MAELHKMNAAAYVSSIQGHPWTLEHHCWELVRTVQHDLFQRELPAFMLAERPGARELVGLFHAHPERQRWVQVAQPQHGSVVLMNKGGPHGRAIHSGVYLALDTGGVLHVDDPHGVVFDGPLELALRGWSYEHFIPGR